MANPNKGFKNCKPNPDIKLQVPQTFYDFVLSFCDNQENNKVTTCSTCNSEAICEHVEIEDENIIHGIFICIDCGTENNRYVNMSQLKEMYDKMKE